MAMGCIVEQTVHLHKAGRRIWQIAVQVAGGTDRRNYDRRGDERYAVEYVHMADVRGIQLTLVRWIEKIVIPKKLYCITIGSEDLVHGKPVSAWLCR